MRIFLLAVLLLSTIRHASSQQFGGSPPSRKWNQINTDTARIIFPAGRDSQASRVASIVHYMAMNKPVSLGDQVKKINIVLQDQTTIPNGYVQLGPYRSEFYLTPDLNNFNQGSISWTDQLALHEYRHVQQYNNFNVGISKLIKILFGQEGYAAATNAAVPEWFFEGDAVYNETVLTKQGRGRLPRFLNAYPSLWQANKKYTWMKLRNGSFKDYVPNHYDLGYLLVNYGREKYGKDFWAKVTRDAASYKGLIYPWQLAVKRHAGIDYKTFVKEAFDSYKTKTPSTPAATGFVFPVNKNYVTNYYFPYSAGADSLIYLKASYRHRPSFFLKDKNGTRKLRTRDISIDEQFSYRNGKIVYSSFENHPRWRWRDFGVIKLLDIQSGRQKKITTKSKYFTPDISIDESRIAAVQVAENGKSELHILDATNGQVVQRLQSTEISLFTDPKFIDNNTLVTAVRLNNGQMALATAVIASGVITRLSPPSYNVVGYPSVDNGVVYYTASYNGNDDIYAIRLADQKIYRLTNGPLGQYFVNAGNGKITWSVVTAEGYQLKQIDQKDLQWSEVGNVNAERFVEKFAVAAGKETNDVLANIPARSFGIRKYSKATNLFNFHSWRPYYEDPIFTYSLYGENVLNTFQTELYYLYNETERTSAVGLSGIYGGFFPYITFGAEHTFDRETPFSNNRIRRWNQLDSRVGLTVPLNWASGKNYKNFALGSNYVLRNEFNKGFYKDSLGTTSFSFLLHTLSWNQQVQRALQDFYPKWGYFISAAHRHVITRYDGWQFNGSANLFLPGIIASHNIQLSGYFQERDTLNSLSFGNRFAYSRGYIGRYFSRMWRLSANYHLPVFYPDWGFANILYFERFRLNMFYDLTKVYSRNKLITADQRSVGGEFYVDTKWWNQYPLTFGIRVSRQLDLDQYDLAQRTRFEFILPISIIPR